MRVGRGGRCRAPSMAGPVWLCHERGGGASARASAAAAAAAPIVGSSGPCAGPGRWVVRGGGEGEERWVAEWPCGCLDGASSRWMQPQLSSTHSDINIH